MIYKFILKRLIDVFFSLLGLILLSPIILVTIGILVIENKGRPFFYQVRPGKNHIPFHIIKFKSMNDKKDSSGNLLPDIDRITSIGKYLRKFSIDELPQLINVLKGEMSLVGPRPLLFKYIELYSSQQNRRHEVLPGITGLAQIKGRNSISWSKKFEYDVYYVDNVSFCLDFTILFKTIIKTFKSEGVNQTDIRPMEPFDGKN